MEAVTEQVLNGVSLAEVAREHPVQWARYHGGLTSLRMLTASPPPLRRPIRTVILWGSTGVGKTHRALTTYPNAVVLSAGRDPFSNYTDEREVVFDEFDDTAWPIREMNKYLDVWRCKLNCRYHDKWAAWTTVIICANTDPSRWYPYEQEPLRQAFFRRCTEIIHVTCKEQIIQLETIIEILNN